VLSPPAIFPNGTASLDLSLFSPHGKGPAAVQWTFHFSSTMITNLTVDDGPTLTSAGKTAICAGDATAYNCLAVGMTTRPIGNGIIVKLTALLAPGASAAPILIKSSLGASAEGFMMPVDPKVLSDFRADVPPYCRPQLQWRNPVGK